MDANIKASYHVYISDHCNEKGFILTSNWWSTAESRLHHANVGIECGEGVGCHTWSGTRDCPQECRLARIGKPNLSHVHVYTHVHVHILGRKLHVQAYYTS